MHQMQAYWRGPGPIVEESIDGLNYILSQLLPVVSLRMNTLRKAFSYKSAVVFLCYLKNYLIHRAQTLVIIACEEGVSEQVPPPTSARNCRFSAAVNQGPRFAGL